MTIDTSVDSKGVQRFIVGQWPVLDPETKEVLIDSAERRSYNTSAAWGPSVNEQILMGYLPHEYASEGQPLLIEYFGEQFPVTVRGVGARGLYDPENLRVRTPGSVTRNRMPINPARTGTPQAGGN